ncbi:argininosuccinate lyase [Butyricimonas synergistica]|uniref:argininosuccinate lyase n=1 Tax=Butyricimonas synergistica TaxID=544644 RepID=UPI0004776DDA|nr:argininosuccinate lyase [Butyricimonas synergistica]
MRLWDKGYDIDAFTESFTIGKDRELDVMLAKADVTGSLAHLEMLHAIGLVSDEEHGQLRVALVSIYEQVERGEFVIEEGIEDVHSQVELMLVRECGDAGKKIHTGRSRNDQVLLDLKLFSREALFEILENMKRLFMLLIQRAGESRDILLPGYTHLQVAMPSSFGLWFSAYAESLADDLLMLKAGYDMVNSNPLGSGAGYGSSIALNRGMTTRLLGFPDLAYNVVYAQMQRGKMEKNVLFGLATVATTLGRLAADVCLFACGNFGFVHLPDKYTTGSSIMPHKKNPDIFELIRAKCNRLQALPTQMAMICGNLTSGYFRDMQLTKELYLPAFGELNDCLFMAHLVLKDMELKRDILDDPCYGYIFSVEDVNGMVIAGVPFREAYRVIGERVQRGEYHAGVREIHHTHEGSIGNLCLHEITDKFNRRMTEWDISAVREAEKRLLTL